MLKSAKWIVAGVAGLLLAAGIGLTEAWEYLQVARAEVNEAVKDRIPIPVEIDRLKLLVRLDSCFMFGGDQSTHRSLALVARRHQSRPSRATSLRGDKWVTHSQSAARSHSSSADDSCSTTSSQRSLTSFTSQRSPGFE